MPRLRLPRPHPPRTRLGWIVTGSGTFIVVGAAALAGVYLVVAGGTSPPPLALSTPAPASTAASTATGTAPGPSAQVAGGWTVGAGSIAGYRVREQLASLPALSDAVGRTSSVTGTLTLTESGAGLTLSEASVRVDVSTLSSDRSMRDQRIRSIGLESARYPTATFTLTTPVLVPAEAAAGQAVTLAATGELTMHGTTRMETIPLQARLTGAQIEVAGSITFGWGDFGMTAPSIGGFVSVTDRATMEFDLHLQHA